MRIAAIVAAVNPLRAAVASTDVLSPYPQLVRAGFQRYSSYRQAALAGLATLTRAGRLRTAFRDQRLAQLLELLGTAGTRSTVEAGKAAAT